MASSPQAGHCRAVRGRCFIRQEVNHTTQGDDQGIPYSFILSSFQSALVSTDPAILGSALKSFGSFFGLLGQNGHEYPKIPSVARNLPAPVTLAILRICLFLECSLRTGERREMFQTVGKAV